jgi:hypothetical protein
LNCWLGIVAKTSGNRSPKKKKEWTEYSRITANLKREEEEKRKAEIKKKRRDDQKGKI